jgi:hypothetical protein
MNLSVPTAVTASGNVISDTGFTIDSDGGGSFHIPGSVAYPPLVNGHDHLIGNWWPRAGTHRPYVNSHIWVEDMKDSESFHERNRVWLNDGSFHLTEGTAPLIIDIGLYKNLFSGVGIVQDHGPNQIPEYYANRPIRIIEKYRQCHSLTLGNWWGGEDPVEELRQTNGEMPFIVHLGEGLDPVTQAEFEHLVELNLDAPNTVLVHGISLSADEFRHCTETGMSVCWCPTSNLYLIGETLNIRSAIDEGTRIILGTDSAMSGSINLFDELRNARKILNSPQTLFRMVTSDARRALMLNDDPNSVLVLERRKADPFENLLAADPNAIRFFVFAGTPVCGEARFLDAFDVNPADYTRFRSEGTDRFVIGHPDITLNTIAEKLGTRKSFPFLPL